MKGNKKYQQKASGKLLQSDTQTKSYNNKVPNLSEIIPFSYCTVGALFSQFNTLLLIHKNREHNLCNKRVYVFKNKATTIVCTATIFHAFIGRTAG
jgi:hypothetical protein